MFGTPPHDSLESCIDDLSSPHAGVRGIAIWSFGRGLYSQATFPLVDALITENKRQLRSDIIEVLLLMKEKGILERASDSHSKLKISFQNLMANSKEQKEQENLDIIYKALWPKG